jgi:hypothetical protein
MRRRGFAARISLMMKDNVHIDAWVADVVQKIGKLAFQEDDRVEVRPEWPTNHYESARTIAGLVNASGGQEVLLLIGIDPEKNPPFTGCNPSEPENWLPTVMKYFIGGAAPPTYRLTQQTFEEFTCAAIVFDSMDAPFLVKNPEHGISKGHVIDSEIPWRCGAGARSARRSEILSLMHRYSHRPHFELVRSQASLGPDPNGAGRSRLNIILTIYAMSGNADPIILPRHRISWRVDYGKGFISVEEGAFRFNVFAPEAVEIRVSDIIIKKSGLMLADIALTVERRESETIGLVKVRGLMHAGIGQLPITINQEIPVQR